MADALELSPALRDYIYSVAVTEPEPLTRLRAETAQLEYASMQISPDIGQTLRFLIHATGARRALEIGVFTGYSGACVALALPDDGTLVACDVSESWTSIGRRYWAELGVAHKIDLRIAPALETLDSLLADGGEGSFDFAFIDADKHNYLSYYERALRLVRKGGVIAADNVLWGGMVADVSVHDADTVSIREFNRFLHGDPRVFVSMLAVRDGVTLAWKK